MPPSSGTPQPMPKQFSPGLLARRVAAVLALPRAVLAAAVACPPAQASDNLQSLMMDDDLLVYNTPDVRAFTMDFMHRLGVDGVRVTVSWKFVADDLRRQPARLRGAKAANPRNYRADIWDRFDAIV